MGFLKLRRDVDVIYFKVAPKKLGNIFRAFNEELLRLLSVFFLMERLDDFGAHWICHTGYTSTESIKKAPAVRRVLFRSEENYFVGTAGADGATGAVVPSSSPAPPCVLPV